FGKKRHMELIDLGNLSDLGGVVIVMRERVVRVGHPDLRVCSPAGLASELESDDASNVSLERQQLEVEHQSRVGGIGRRDADGPIEIGQIAVFCVDLGLLDSPLDLANSLEVQPDAGTVRRTELRFQARDLFADRVEQAGSLLQGRAAVGGATAFAEEAFEYDS